jgi:hypothetical protein
MRGHWGRGEKEEGRRRGEVRPGPKFRDVR